jgi:glycosyltransferase involved in cell wall biosynthesis
MEEKVVIVVASFCRPKLLGSLLDSLSLLNASNTGIEIVVADNDKQEQQAHTVVSSRRLAGYRFPLHVVLAAERGISSARNTGIKVALTIPGVQYVAMIDDDEVADAGWLNQLLRMKWETGADIIGGPVLPIFEATPPPWAIESRLYIKNEFCDGNVSFIPRTSNLLVVAELFRKISPPWFDSSFSFTGGADLDFLLRAKRAGARFAWASKAFVSEAIPVSRMTKVWLRQRAYRIGNCYILVHKKHGLNWWATIGIMLRSCLGVAYRLVCFVVRCYSEASRVRNVWSICWHLGKIGALVGHRYEEYRRSHGH